ncbi:hypothetical protein RCL1_002902 [Eukaryota sp. TZLM3-RCL]
MLTTTPARKFPVLAVENVLKQTSSNFLRGKSYSVDDTPVWTRELADMIRDQLKELNLDRYKFVVQVSMIENRNQGLYHGVKFFWDEDCDRLASHVYSTDSLFCGISVFALYVY